MKTRSLFWTTITMTAVLFEPALVRAANNESSGSTRRSLFSPRSSGSSATTPDSGNISTSGGAVSVTRSASFDRRFLTQAAQLSRNEIAAGHVAQTNSQNANVQGFGAMLIQDHTVSLQQAQALAASLGLTVSSGGSSALLRSLQRLGSTGGASFDEAFINLQIQDHRRSIQVFEDAAIRARTASVRAYARAQLPVLLEHLLTALEIRETLLVEVTTQPDLGSTSTGGTSTATTRRTSGGVAVGTTGGTTGSFFGTTGTTVTGTTTTQNTIGTTGGTVVGTTGGFTGGTTDGLSVGTSAHNIVNPNPGVDADASGDGANGAGTTTRRSLFAR